MINGRDPIIVFHFFRKPPKSLFYTNEYAARLNEVLTSSVGLPVPFPLNERLTGLVINNETRGVQLSTRVDPSTEKDQLTNETKAPVVNQTVEGSDVTISMTGLKENIMLTAFLALSEQIVSKAVSAEYGISYFNGPVAIFNALLSRIQTINRPNTDAVDIELVLSTAKKEAPKLPGETAKGATPIANAGRVSL